MHTIKAAHAEDDEEETKPTKFEQAHKAEGVMPGEHTKKVPLCEDVPDRTVTIGRGLEEDEEARIHPILEEKSGHLRMVIFGPARSQQRNHGT